MPRQAGSCRSCRTLAPMASVVVVPFSSEWSKRFAEIRSELQSVFPAEDVRIEHIGSTSVQGLAAKPIIDVLLGVESLASIEGRIQALSRLGYEYIAKYESQLPMRRYFVRAQTGLAPGVHVHGVQLASQFWAEHILFRECLRASPELVRQYQELKVRLASQFSDDVIAYTAAKAPFISSVLASRQREQNVG